MVHPRSRGRLILTAALCLAPTVGVAAPDDDASEKTDAARAVAEAVLLQATLDGSPNFAPPPLDRLVFELLADPALAGLDPDRPALHLPALRGHLGDHADVARAVDEFAADAVRRLELELDRLEGACRGLQVDAETLKDGAESEDVFTREEAGDYKNAGAVLALAARSLLLRDELRKATSPAETLRVLQFMLERPIDPLVEAWLGLLPELAQAPPAALRDSLPGEVERLLSPARRQLNASLRAMNRALDYADAAALALRASELRVDSAPRRRLEEAFSPAPGLQPTGIFGVYEDAQRRPYVETEAGWVQAPDRSLQSVADVLLTTESPWLRVHAVRAESLLRLSQAFDPPRAASGTWFQDALLDVIAVRRRVVERAAELRRALPHHPDALDRAAPERAGVSLASLELTPEAWRDHLLLTSIEDGPEATRRLTTALREGARALDALRVGEATLTFAGLPEGVAIDLVWRPVRVDGRAPWLLAPPVRITEHALSVPLTWVAGEAPAAGVLDAFAQVDGTPHQARAEWTASASVTLTFEALPGPHLEVEVQRGAAQVTVLPLDAPRPELWVEAPSGARRPLYGTTRGGWFLPDPREPAGVRTITAFYGRERSTVQTWDAPAARGVVLGLDDASPWWTVAGQDAFARVLEGGREVRGPHVFTVVNARGGVVGTVEGARFLWDRPLEVGRYRILVDDVLSAEWAVVARAPGVQVVRDPFALGADPAETVQPGEGVFLRLDAWPALEDADGAAQIDWTIAGRHTATSYPRRDPTAAAGLLPFTLPRDARAGARELEARVVTARGTLTLGGRVQVGRTSNPVEVELRDPAGDPVDWVARGAAWTSVASVTTALETSSWVLVDPLGAPRTLLPDEDGGVPVVLPRDAVLGEYTLWVHGVERGVDGREVHARRTLDVYAPERVALDLPRPREQGKPLTVRVTPPAGYRAPFRIRFDLDRWTDARPASALTLERRVAVEQTWRIQLRDALGRFAQRAVTFRADGADPGPIALNPDPGPSDPGPSDPGPSDPGPSDPGPSDPGPSDPGPSDPGPSDPGPSDPGPSDPGPSDPGPSEPGPSDPGPSDPGPNDPGPSDPGPSDPGPNDPGPNDPGPNDPGPSDPGPNDPSPNDPGPSDPVPVAPEGPWRLVETRIEGTSPEAWTWEGRGVGVVRVQDASTLVVARAWLPESVEVGETGPVWLAAVAAPLEGADAEADVTVELGGRSPTQAQASADGAATLLLPAVWEPDGIRCGASAEATPGTLCPWAEGDERVVVWSVRWGADREGFTVEAVYRRQRAASSEPLEDVVQGEAPSPSLEAALGEAAEALEQARPLRRRAAARLLSKAEVAIVQAWCASPDDPRPWALWAELAAARRQVELCRALAQRSLELGPSARAYLVLAEIDYLDVRLDAARRAWEAAAALDPQGSLRERHERLGRSLR